MSARLCNTQIIGLLAHFAIDNKATIYGSCYGQDLETTDKVVNALTRANLLSLSVRYPDMLEPTVEFLDLSMANYIKQCNIDASRMWVVPLIDILKACDYLAYQACEYADWYKSKAHRILVEIRKSAISKLPGYENASWEFGTDNPPPALRKMSKMGGCEPLHGEVISLFS